MSYVSAPKPQGESSENEFLTNFKISQPLTIISISSGLEQDVTAEIRDSRNRLIGRNIRKSSEEASLVEKVSLN